MEVVLSLVSIIGLTLFLLSQATAVPWVKREFARSGEIGVGPFMVWRGGVVFVFGCAYYFSAFVDKELPSLTEWSLAFWCGVATLSFYQALRYWPGSVVMIVLCMTPVANFLFAIFRGEALSRSALLATACLLIGSGIGLFAGKKKNEEKTYSLIHGAVWSTAALITNAFLYEVISSLLNNLSDKGDVLEQQVRVFILIGLGITVVGACFSKAVEMKASLKRKGAFFSYAFIVGVLYFAGFAMIFQSMPLQWASPLTMLELPALMLGFRLIVGKSEELTPVQYIGVAIAMIPPIIIKLTTG